VRKSLVWGAAAVAVYFAASLVLASSGHLVRPLFDGLAPPVPYRFVSPPPGLESQNESPQSGTGIIDLVGGGSVATSVSTGDGQMQIVIPKDTFPARPGEQAVLVRISPLAPPDPTKVPGGLVITGNAYLVTAMYRASRSPATPRTQVTAVLRYPAVAKEMVRRDDGRWARLSSQISAASLQLFAGSDRLGVFAAAGRRQHKKKWIPYAAAAVGVVAGVIGYLQGVRSARRKRTR
jgi:hypothetical protein